MRGGSAKVWHQSLSATNGASSTKRGRSSLRLNSSQSCPSRKGLQLSVPSLSPAQSMIASAITATLTTQDVLLSHRNLESHLIFQMVWLAFKRRITRTGTSVNQGRLCSGKNELAKISPTTSLCSKLTATCLAVELAISI